jgi:hypothetical protein
VEISSYSLRDLVRLTGAKRSQVENWVRTRVLLPHTAGGGTGISRTYTFHGLVLCSLAVLLSRYRIPAPEIAWVIHEFLGITGEVRSRSRYSGRPSRSEFLASWRNFIDPDQRPWGRGATLYYVPDTRQLTLTFGEYLEPPDAETYIVVDLGKIFRRLEQDTNDSWVA